MNPASPALSFVIPLYNSAETIGALVQTIEGLVEQAKAAGREIPFQDLNELGRDVLDQIKTGVYCIQMNGNGPSAERLHERADRFGQGLNPTA